MNILNAAGQASQVIGFILLLVTALGGLGRFFIFNPLRREIKEATRPIHPSSNGGLSLPDVARKLDKLELRQDHTDSQLDLVISLLRKQHFLYQGVNNIPDMEMMNVNYR